jgi:cation diffusion facilitator family transporter
MRNPQGGFTVENAIIAGKCLSGVAGRWSASSAGGRIFIELTPETGRRAGEDDTEDVRHAAKTPFKHMKIYVKVALLSCLVNGLLMTAKYFLGEASGSMALKADAVHSLADVVSSLSILGGILISDRKTKTFPLGLYKVENLVALLSSFLIFFAAYEIACEALYAEPTGVITNLGLVTAGIVCMLIVTYLFSRYELKAGLKAGSPSLVADAKHIATDMISSLAILVAILGTHLSLSLDRYVAIFVVALVIHMGLTILIGSLKVLLDATLDYSTLNEIRAVLESHPLVKGIISLGGRSSGRYKFVEANVKLDARLLREAHEVVSHLEEDILDRWPDIDRILIHYEPEQKACIHIAAPVNAPTGTGPGLDSLLSDHFGEAPFFALLRKERHTGNVTFETYVANRFRSLERHRGVRAAELLDEMDIDEVWTRVALDGKGAGYALESLGIDVLTTEATTLRELLSEIAEDSDELEIKPETDMI